MQTNMMMDAQSAMAFAISQATRVNAKVYETKYPEIRYRGLVPVDTTGPEWVKSVTYMSLDGAGQAEWLNAAADDVPKAELLRAKTETTVSMAGIGYGWDLAELAQAQQLGINLGAAKGKVARRAAEEKVDQVAFFGDPEKGFTGVTNNPDVTKADAAATGTGSSTNWSKKTPGQILSDVNGAISGVFTGTMTTGLANTVLLPYTQMHDIGTLQLSENTETTVLQWLRTNNVFTMETGQPLTIRGVRGLEKAGQSKKSRMVAYRNSEDVLKLNMPMPFRFFPVWQTGPWRFDVPGAFRIGGVDFLLPKEAAYVDGI